MADHDSIASRMQKLAELKRRKAGAKPSQEADAAEETIFMMPAPERADEPRAAVLTAEDDDSYAAPPLGGADESAEDAAAHEATPAAEGSAVAERPARQVEDRDDDSLDSYFAALGIAPEDAEENPAESDPRPKADTQAAQLDGDEDDFAMLLDTVEPEEDEPAADMPDFSAAEVDPETIAREFEHEDAAMPQRAATETSDDSPCVSVTFDESRTTLLKHVSRQMNCSVEDVVVTALDWYLDALFGEDEAKAG